MKDQHIEEAQDELYAGTTQPDDNDDYKPLISASRAIQYVKELQRYVLTRQGKEWDQIAPLFPGILHSLCLDAQNDLQQVTLDSLFTSLSNSISN
jgi:hypothetical protein